MRLFRETYSLDIIINTRKADCYRQGVHVILVLREVRTLQGGLPSSEGQPSRRKKGGMLMYVTYSDLIQIGIFIVALIGLIYEIFKDKK